MSNSERVRCRCGQQFTAWLINGAPRTRCPYCKAPLSQSDRLAERTGADAARTDRTGGDPAGADSAGADPAGVDRAGADFAGSERPGSERPGDERVDDAARRRESAEPHAAAAEIIQAEPVEAPPPTGPTSPFASSASLPAIPAPRQAASRPKTIRVPRDPRATSAAAGVPAAVLGAMLGLLVSPWMMWPTALLLGALAAGVGFLFGRLFERRAALAEWSVPCPRCRERRIVRSGCTWWGGWLGTRLARHVQCADCGRSFIGTTGDEDRYAITTVAATRAALALLILTVLLIYLFAGGSP